MSVISIHGRDSGAFAKSVLHQLLQHGDVAGRTADGRTVLQLSVDDWLLEELCTFDADAEDLEDAEGEPEPDQEFEGPATVLDFVPPKQDRSDLTRRAGCGPRPAARDRAPARCPCRPGACHDAAALERGGATAMLPGLP